MGIVITLIEGLLVLGVIWAILYGVVLFAGAIMESLALTPNSRRARNTENELKQAGYWDSCALAAVQTSGRTQVWVWTGHEPHVVDEETDLRDHLAAAGYRDIVLLHRASADG